MTTASNARPSGIYQLFWPALDAEAHTPFYGGRSERMLPSAARGVCDAAKPSRHLGVAFLLALCLSAWVGEAKTQPIIPEADIIKSLRPAPRTRSFTIDRVPAGGTPPSGADAMASTGTSDTKPPQQGSVTEAVTSLAVETTSAAAQRPELALVIQFVINSAEIQSSSFSQLNMLSNAMLSPDLGSYSFNIEGHTDSSGPPSFNLRLSERRAQAISRYLQTRGVTADRLHPVGLGSSRPLSGASATGHANRRVVIGTKT